MQIKLLAYIGAIVLKLFGATYRFRYINEGLLSEALKKGGVILPFWHNRIIGACTAPIFRPLDTVAVVSRHSDGELITQIMAKFGHRAVRGSSKKGGSEALKELETELKKGAVIGITPDGPQGPRYKLQSGVAVLCERTERPIIPFIAIAKSRWKFNSWDGFELPKPFTEIKMIFGPRIELCGDVDKTMLRVETAMKEKVVEGESLFGRAPDFQVN